MYASLYLHLHTMIILRRIRAAVRIAPADPSERTELVQNIHDGHLRARQVLGHGVCQTIRFFRFLPKLLRCAVFRLFISEKMRSHSDVSTGMSSAITTRRQMSG